MRACCRCRERSRSLSCRAHSVPAFVRWLRIGIRITSMERSRHARGHHATASEQPFEPCPTEGGGRHGRRREGSGPAPSRRWGGGRAEIDASSPGAGHGRARQSRGHGGTRCTRTVRVSDDLLTRSRQASYGIRVLSAEHACPLPLRMWRSRSGPRTTLMAVISPHIYFARVGTVSMRACRTTSTPQIKERPCKKKRMPLARAHRAHLHELALCLGFASSGHAAGKTPGARRALREQKKAAVRV